MSTVRKTITLTRKQDDWIKTQIERGDYTNDSECIRDLIRREQERQDESPADIDAIRAALIAGEQSGLSAKSIDDIWAEARARRNGHRRSRPAPFNAPPEKADGTPPPRSALHWPTAGS